ncbi:MAG: flagellar protein FliT [Betaproteobacteria bacterium]|nr:flagellar protein FliT [Betaproteobacteria bacterium]
MTTSNQNATETRILSLAEGHALLALYETMVETARTHDWDRLAEIERQAATLRDSAIARPFSPPVVEDVGELSILLSRIQRLDHEVRSLVEPAHEQARQQLAVEVRGRAVREAYGNLEMPRG